MNRWDLSRYIMTSCMAAALLAGCGGSPPIVDSNAVAQRSNALSATEVQFVTQGDVDPRRHILEFDYPNGTAPIRRWRLAPRLHPSATCTGGAHTYWVVFPKTMEIQEFAVGHDEPVKTLTVTGGLPRAPSEKIEPQGDHRVALAASVLGCAAGPLAFDGGPSVDISFPDFIPVLKSLRVP